MSLKKPFQEAFFDIDDVHHQLRVGLHQLEENISEKNESWGMIPVLSIHTWKILVLARQRYNRGHLQENTETYQYQIEKQAVCIMVIKGEVLKDL